MNISEYFEKLIPFEIICVSKQPERVGKNLWKAYANGGKKSISSKQTKFLHTLSDCARIKIAAGDVYHGLRYVDLVGDTMRGNSVDASDGGALIFRGK